MSRSGVGEVVLSRCGGQVDAAEPVHEFGGVNNVYAYKCTKGV